MIYAAPGASFEAVVSGLPTGLAGTARVRILDNVGATVFGPSTAGIVELVAGSGSYAVTLTAPATGGQFTVLWDTGTVSPSTTAAEDLVVTADLPPGAAPSGALTTVAAVKLAMGANSGGSDARIEATIFDASDAIYSWSGREWIGPDDPEARRFVVGETLPVRIGDLAATPTAVTLEASDGSLIGTLDVSDDLIYGPLERYAGEPIETIALTADAGYRLAAGQFVVVTGQWGWPAVPRRVGRACIHTVRSWLRTDASSSASHGYDDGGRVVQATPEGGWMLPIAAKQLLANDRRRGVA